MPLIQAYHWIMRLDSLFYFVVSTKFDQVRNMKMPYECSLSSRLVFALAFASESRSVS